MSLMADAHVGTAATVGRLFSGIIHLPAAAVVWLQARLELARSRDALLRLDDRMLTDIGLDRATARLEGERGFWG